MSVVLQVYLGRADTKRKKKKSDAEIDVTVRTQVVFSPNILEPFARLFVYHLDRPPRGGVRRGCDCTPVHLTHR